MTPSRGRIGLLVPEGRDRELIRDIVVAEGWTPTFPGDTPEPEGPWPDVELLVVDLAWLRRCSSGIERTKRQAGSEFLPVLLVCPRESSPDVPPPLCDQLLTYPTTRATFAGRLRSLMRIRTESRRVYRSFVENALIGVYRATRDGEILFANQALARMLGCRDLEEVRSRGIRIPGLGPSSGSGGIVEQLRRGDAAEPVQEEWRPDEDRPIHVLHRARLVDPLPGLEGQSVVEGTVEDVTELIVSREKLAASERFLQRAIDALSAHVAILSPEGEILGVNQAWQDFESSTRPPGWSDVGVNYLDVCDASDDAIGRQVAQGIRDVVRGRRRVFQLEYPCHSPTEYRWFRVVVTAFPEVPPRRTVVAHENITELKEAQRRFQLLIEGSEELTLVISDTGFVKYRSPSAAEFVGDRDLEGSEIRRFVHPGDREGLNELLAAAESAGTVEFRLRHDDGAWRDIEWTVTDMRDTPMVHGVVLHGRDVTERKGMLAELQKQEREIREMQKMEAVGRLAGGVAHDFNNLLTTIQGNLTLAGQGLADGAIDEPGEIEDFLSEIARAAEQGSFLTRRLLTFSRQEPDADPSVQDLNEILRGMGRMVERLVPEIIDTSSELADESLPIRIRSGDAEQVVMNLVVNASHAMREGGDLILRSRRIELGPERADRGAPAGLSSGSYAVMEVVDTGEGIPPEVKEKIFEPFFTTKPRGEGTGLGLSTVYGILNRAGGGISVESEVGLGSRFICYVPLVEERPDRSAARDGPARGDIEGGETLLIAEDEESVRTVARRGLERLGYTVLEAEHGRAALDVLASLEPGTVSAIVTDFVMPEMSGLELIREVHVRYPGIPVLITSGYQDTEVELDPEVTWAFLSKPYDLADLAACVRELIDGNGDGDPT